MSADRPNWTPTERSSENRCLNCGEPVTPQFARVFGDNSDIAHACPSCTDNRHLARAASNARGGLQ